MATVYIVVWDSLATLYAADDLRWTFDLAEAQQFESEREAERFVSKLQEPRNSIYVSTLHVLLQKPFYDFVKFLTFDDILSLCNAEAERIISDFDALSKATREISEIDEPDLLSGDVCPTGCGGILDGATHPLIGCSCHTAPPCGGCCPGVLRCGKCHYWIEKAVS